MFNAPDPGVIVIPPVLVIVVVVNPLGGDRYPQRLGAGNGRILAEAGNERDRPLGADGDGPRGRTSPVCNLRERYCSAPESPKTR